MQKVLVLCSSELELAPLVDLLDDPTVESIDAINTYLGRYHGLEVIFAMTGVGLVNAASVATLLAKSLNVDYMGFCGVAGAVANDLQIGDVVIASEVAQAELFTTMAAVENTPFVDCMRNPNLDEFPPQWYPSLQLKALENNTCRVISGRIVSTDQFPAPQKEYALLLKKNVSALDMETAAIYQVGWMFNIPTFAVRAMSNKILSDGTDPEMHAADVELAPKNAAVITMQLIRDSICHSLAS